MKQILLIIFCLSLPLMGCGKQEQTDTNESTPTTNTNKVDGTTEKPDKELTLREKAEQSETTTKNDETEGWVSNPSDPNSVKIEKAIRESLKWPVGEITKEDLEQIKGLRLDDYKLTDVKSLEKLTQLRKVNLSGNQLTSVKGLEKLTQLTYLALYNNPALTKAQIDQLQKALPKCEIIRIGMPEPALSPPRKTP